MSEPDELKSMTQDEQIVYLHGLYTEARDERDDLRARAESAERKLADMERQAGAMKMALKRIADIAANLGVPFAAMDDIADVATRGLAGEPRCGYLSPAEVESALRDLRERCVDVVTCGRDTAHERRRIELEATCGAMLDRIRALPLRTGGPSLGNKLSVDARLE